VTVEALNVRGLLPVKPKLPAVMELTPLRTRLPPLVLPRTPPETVRLPEPRAEPLLTFKVPAERVVPPVYEFAVLKVNAPLPILTSDMDPLITPEFPEETESTLPPPIEFPLRVPIFTEPPLKLVVPAPLRLAKVAVERNSRAPSFWTEAKVPDFVTNNVPAATVVGLVNLTGESISKVVPLPIFTSAPVPLNPPPEYVPEVTCRVPPSTKVPPFKFVTWETPAELVVSTKPPLTVGLITTPALTLPPTILAVAFKEPATTTRPA